MSLNHTERFQALVPLSNFNWNGNCFTFPNFGIIQRLSQSPDLSRFKRFLSDEDISDLADVSHWLLIKQGENDTLSPTEKCSILLLGLWLALPTRVQIKFRFECKNSSRGAARLLDRFQWIREQAKYKIETKHLKEAARYIDSLRVLCSARKRLYLSLTLTYQGSLTIHWRVAFICFAAAVEGILTYSEGRGVTKRLATSYACLTKSEKSERDSSYLAFLHSYKIRSEIIHGRASYLDNAEENRKELARFSDLLRELWKTVLLDKGLIHILERDDRGRKNWFSRLENGYQPPKAAFRPNTWRSSDNTRGRRGIIRGGCTGKEDQYKIF